ncbi:myogenesis-regulating glycosidase-like isoform X2 [Liolophura sinensis]|uniref:myogenesis-regulating glycosidase-like isoform X2 n=1 Tax=Liolophura sinensis TaxID=3198878 RepID=UPI003158CECB
MTKMDSEQEAEELLSKPKTATSEQVEMNNLDGDGHSANFKPQNSVVKFDSKPSHKKKHGSTKRDHGKRKASKSGDNGDVSGDSDNNESYVQVDRHMPMFRHRNSTSLVRATIDIPGESLKKIKKKRQRPPGLGLKIVVVILFLMILVGVLVTWSFYKEERLAILSGQKFRFMEDTRTLYLAFDSSDPVEEGVLGLNLPSWQLPKSCSDEWEEINKLCYWWRNGASLKVLYYKLNSMHCYNVTWESLNRNIEPKDCYDIGILDWYGLSANIRGSHHTLSAQNFSYVPLVPGGGRVLGSVVERYWLASNGIAFITSEEDPILLSWNNDLPDKFCIWSSYRHPFYARKTAGNLSHLHYTMCKADNMETTHLAMRQFFNTAPSPQTPVLRDWLRTPVWAIGPVNLTNVTEPLHAMALDLIDFLDSNSTQSCGVVELDFGWETYLGDLAFKTEDLEDITLMLQNLSSHGCQLSLPVSLFSHFLSRNFDYLLRKNYFVRDAGGDAVGLTKWQGDQLAYLDISNPDAVKWFLTKLKILKAKFGIHTFKFLHGESGILPFKAQFKETFDPVWYTTTYNYLVTNFTNTTLMHSGMGTQNLPIAISIMGRLEMRGPDRCLTDIIPSLLTAGILGYPYLALDGSELWSQGIVGEDLFLRWTQMSAFLPVMKVYTPPHGFTPQNFELLKNWTQFHIKTIIPLINKLAQEVMHGAPLIRPIWWVDPQDAVAQGIGDEFLVGNDILVAPVLCEKTRKRNIYLPSGKWKDPLKRLDLDGGRWIYDYRINLEEIPYFLAS